MERGEAASSEHYEQVMYSPYDEHRFCTAIRSIDTVRSLHQTVVSLRSALEDSRQEIEKLRKQILITNEIQDARHCQHSEIPQQQHQIDYKTLDQKVSALEKIYYKAHPQKQQQQQHESKDDTKEKTKIDGNKKTISLVPDITISTQNLNDSSGATTGANNNNNNYQLQNNQMASRIDVKIKVSSNINVTDNSNENETSTEDGASESSESTPQPPTSNDEKEAKSEKRENPKVEVEMYEDSNTNTFNVDGKNLKIRVTSEENINVRRSVERISIQQSSTEYLNLSIDDLSEGDNSVFTEGATTPIETRLQQVDDMTSDTEQALDNETGELPREEREETDDIIEEVDDIELIFSSEDNKDMIQEDLVSISEYEPWQEPGDTGTPVLTKFNTLASDDLDREAYYQKKKALKAARMRAKDKSLESTDSLSFDNNIRSSMDYNASSLDKDSSFENPISRDNSFDAFTRPTTAAVGRGGKKWTNVNVLVETDISKVGIGDENVIEMGRRNTCPNPPIYRPLGYTQNRSSFRTPLASRYPRSISRSNHCPIVASTSTQKSKESGAISKNEDTKCNSSAVQTDITALPHQWRSETHLICNDYGSGYTLPSKYNTPQGHNRSGMKNSLRLSEKTQEQRRVLLSDINFTSMVPELSRSADHLCQQKINEEADEEASDYFKGNLLKTPDYTRGLTPSTSTPGVSQWTVNESTTQTEGFWNNRGDSFDSSKSYSMRSGTSTNFLNKHQRSRSVPSIRCAICKRNHSTIKPSESMHYAASKTVSFREPSQKARGSLPDLRNDCHCSRRCGGKSLLYRMHESSGSTESLLEEADEYMRHCTIDDNSSESIKRCGENRRCSEADAMRGYQPSKQSLPFLPKSPRCLKSGQLAKVIARSGRIVVGKIRFVGPIANADDETYVGLQLPHPQGDCDGTFNGNKFFDCETLHGLFVPYKKVVMAWN